jgi:hypothetical protein
MILLIEASRIRSSPSSGQRAAHPAYRFLVTSSVIAAAGGDTIRRAPCATFGSEGLSRHGTTR